MKKIMPFKILVSLLFTLLITNLINAQEVIPFRLNKHNNIIVKALINETDSLNLMFQIATDQGSISPERSNPAHSILFEDGISKNNSIKIGSLEWNKILFYDNELSGPESDGKIGTSLFKNKIYQIDYDNNQFVIYNKLPDVKNYQRVYYSTNTYHQLFIPITNSINSESFEDVFLLQSGYAGGLLYSNHVADSKDLTSKLEITGEKTLRNSANQSIITKQGILPTLKIDGITMNAVSAGFFAGEIKNQPVNYFGADLIKRFNWIIDQDNKIAYFTPSKYFNDPYFKIN